MFKKDVMIKVASKFGVEIEFFFDKREYYGAYDNQRNVIEIDARETDNQIIQTFVHELTHVQDPKCQKVNVSYIEMMEAELRAEYASQIFMGEDFIDEGNIDYIIEEIGLGRVDINYEKAEKFYSRIMKAFD
jgi:Zn-dependent peptidase ImmA (M78 family)